MVKRNLVFEKDPLDGDKWYIRDGPYTYFAFQSRRGTYHGWRLLRDAKKAVERGRWKRVGTGEMFVEDLRLRPISKNPFKSQAQRRLFYAKARRGEISPKVVREWERATGKRKLPERANPGSSALPEGMEGFGFSDEEMEVDAPDLHYEDLVALERGDTFTIGNRKPVYRVIGEYGGKRSPVKTAVIQGSGERKYYIIRRATDDGSVGAFEAIGGTFESVRKPRNGKTGFVMNIKKASSRPERANPSKKALAKYKDTHWGIEADHVMRKNDPDLPKELVEMGKLLEIGVTPEGKGEAYALTFPDYEKTSLPFSKAKSERLYIVLPRQVEQRLKRDLWKPTEPTLRLGEAGKLAGGRQAGFRSPGIQVQVLGRANYVVYQTQKLDDVKEDGRASHYIHDFGEESGIQPYLTIAEDGTLWLAGGDYRVLRGGIDN